MFNAAYSLPFDLMISESIVADPEVTTLKSRINSHHGNKNTAKSIIKIRNKFFMKYAFKKYLKACG